MMMNFFKIILLNIGVIFPSDLIDFLQRGKRLEKPDLMSDSVSAQMLQCFENDPKTRPTFSQLERELGKMMEDELQSHYLKMNHSF